MLTLIPEVVTALASDNFTMCHIVELPGLKLTNHATSIVWRGDTYNSDGKLLSLGSVTRESEIKLSPYTITLDNADQTALAIFAGGSQTGVEANVWLGIIDANGDLVVDGNNDGPILLYKGTVDTWHSNENPDSGFSKLAVKLTSHWASFKSTAGRFTNSASQEELFPGDSFFEFAAEDAVQIKWGRT